MLTLIFGVGQFDLATAEIVCQKVTDQGTFYLQMNKTGEMISVNRSVKFRVSFEIGKVLQKEET